MSDAHKLKPCPFCGNDGTGPIEDALHICHFEHDFRADSWTVQCDKCSATMGYSDSEDEAIEAWNHRVDLVPAPGWQPIETAPKDGIAILASGLDHGMGPGRHYSIVKWVDFGCKTGWYPYEDDIPLTYLTHWMPLPAPPSEGVEP